MLCCHSSFFPLICLTNIDCFHILAFFIVYFLFRCVSFTGCYFLSSKCLMEYLRPIAGCIECLNLNYCYWLSLKCCGIIMKCINLISLHVLHIEMSAKRLVDMLSSLKKLQRISFTIKDVRDFQTELDRNAGAQEALSSVKVMTVQVRNDPVQAQIMTMHFMAVTSFFEYCSSLEEFHVHGLFCTRGVPPYVVNPQVSYAV